MKPLLFSLISLIAIISLPVLNGCYTSFRAVGQHSPSDFQGQDAGYYDDEQYYEGSYYYDEELPDEEEYTELQFKPSRLVVTETHYAYGDYIKEVKYIVHDPYPWLHPYYYDYGYARWHFNIYFSFRPWYYGGYYGGYYPIIWTPPGYAWYNPWFDWFVCYPYYGPVYHPYPVYYPYPVYHHPPYYGYKDRRDYKKRNWDRRQPTRNRHIATRRSPGSSGTKGKGRGSIARVNRAPERKKDPGLRGGRRNIAPREGNRGTIRTNRDSRGSEHIRTKPRKTQDISPRKYSRSDEGNRDLKKYKRSEKNKDKRDIRTRQSRLDKKPRPVAKPPSRVRNRTEKKETQSGYKPRDKQDARSKNRSNSWVTRDRSKNKRSESPSNYQKQQKQENRSYNRPKPQVRREKNKSENRSKQITRPARNSRPKDTRINRKSENRSRSSRQESPQQKESKSQNRSSKRRGR